MQLQPPGNAAVEQAGQREKGRASHADDGAVVVEVEVRDPAARAGGEAKTLLLAPDGFSG